MILMQGRIALLIKYPANKAKKSPAHDRTFFSTINDFC